MDWLFSIIFSYEAVPVYSLLVAVIAVWFTIRESRRNNNVIVQILKFTYNYSQSLNENNTEPFSQLRIVIQNKGITLHNLRLVLSYTGQDFPGRFSVPIPVKNTSPNSSFCQGEFSKGMTAEFCFKSYELSAIGPLKGTLKDIRTQNVTLCIFSQNYLAKIIKIGGPRDRIASLWNKYAGKIRYKKIIGTDSQGHENVKRYGLPIFTSREEQLKYFIESLEIKDHGLPHLDKKD